LARPLALRRLAALHSAGPTAPTPRLSQQQLDTVDQALRRGARANGFDTDHWTLGRIAAVIERVTGVGYHRGHVWKLLRHRFKWKRVSMAAGLCYGSRGGGAAPAFHYQLGAYDTDTLIGALDQLRRFPGKLSRPVDCVSRCLSLVS
jgi:hypothetical protein